MAAVAAMKDVSFSYGTSPVLDNLNFPLHAGDYALLTGENGSGKSTFLKLLLGELSPRHGSVRLFGLPVSPSVFGRFRIGYVPQNSISRNQNFPATVQEIMETGLPRNFIRKSTSKERLERIRAALSELEMQDFLFRQISALSGGQQQRIMLARALAAAPQMLILDEPSSGVDHASFSLLCHALQRQNQNNQLTILLVTHGNTDSFCGANRLFHMENGRIS